MLLTTSWSGFPFNGVQSVFTAYFVTYLVAFGYELGRGRLPVLRCGRRCSAVPGALGWVGSFHVRPRLVMAGLALGMAGSVGLVGTVHAGLANSCHGAGRRRSERDRDVVAWHPAVRNRPPRDCWQRRRGDRWRFVFWSNRCVPRAVRFCLLVAPDWRLWARLGCAVPALWVGISLLMPRSVVELSEGL